MIDGNRALVDVDHPHLADASVEVLATLASHLGIRVAIAEDFYG
jgi:hypothetical protein